MNWTVQMSPCKSFNAHLDNFNKSVILLHNVCEEPVPAAGLPHLRGDHHCATLRQRLTNIGVFQWITSQYKCTAILVAYSMYVCICAVVLKY